jgi:hypothetical protein
LVIEPKTGQKLHPEVTQIGHALKRGFQNQKSKGLFGRKVAANPVPHDFP